MRKAYFIWFLIAAFFSEAQKSINKIPFNNIGLGSGIEAFSGEVFLFTGDEDIFDGNPNLKENVLRNISKGIEEGIYFGYELHKIAGIEATRFTLFFYQRKLYKARWSFQKNSVANFNQSISKIKNHIVKTYGQGKEEIPELLRIWETKKKYLQLFSEEEEIQIEYRDPKIHEKVELLKNQD